MSKVLAVGDIHTKIWIIDQVEKLVEEYDEIVFIGDYADDWGSTPGQSIQTWMRMKQIQSKYPDKVKALVGNHDFAYLLSFNPRSSGHNNTTQMLINSPDNRELKRWLSGLPVRVDIDGVVYTHAGVDAHWNESSDERFLWRDDSPIWTRPENTIYGPEPQVFGHTPQHTCTEIEENIWCIDTFSTYRDGSPIGDETVLEIIDGTEFKIKKLEKNENNSNTSSFEDKVSR